MLTTRLYYLPQFQLCFTVNHDAFHEYFARISASMSSAGLPFALPLLISFTCLFNLCVPSAFNFLVYGLIQAYNDLMGYFHLSLRDKMYIYKKVGMHP